MGGRVEQRTPSTRETGRNSELFSHGRQGGTANSTHTETQRRGGVGGVVYAHARLVRAIACFVEARATRDFTWLLELRARSAGPRKKSALPRAREALQPRPTPRHCDTATPRHRDTVTPRLRDSAREECRRRLARGPGDARTTAVAEDGELQVAAGRDGA